MHNFTTQLHAVGENGDKIHCKRSKQLVQAVKHMPIWVGALLVVAAFAGSVPFFYARKLARGEGAPDEATPKWFGGFQNPPRVASMLRKHSQEGDLWARGAYWVYCGGFAIGPATIAVLFIHDYWSR